MEKAFKDYTSLVLPWQELDVKSENDRVDAFAKEVADGKMLQVKIPLDLLKQMVKEKKSKKSRGMF